MKQPAWFYNTSHVVEEAAEIAGLQNYQAGLTWWENGEISPRSDTFRRLQEDGSIRRKGATISWNSLDDLLDFGHRPTAIGRLEIHVRITGCYLVKTAVRIDRRESGTTYGTVVQLQVNRA